MNKLNKQVNQQIIPILQQSEQEKTQDWRENTIEFTQVQFRLDRQIEDPEYYREILSRIESLSKNDAVELVIDSVGGSLDGCIAICDALQSTPASVTGILVNRAYSAGAFIALCCDNLEVRPYARMMLHSFSGGFSGKDHEIELDYSFNKEYIRDFLSDCCFGFLEEEELDEMFNGKDWWFNASDIIMRLQKRRQTLQELEESEDDQESYKECQCDDCKEIRQLYGPYEDDDCNCLEPRVESSCIEVTEELPKEEPTKPKRKKN